MEWLLPFTFIFGGLMVLLAIGIPVALAFLIVNLLGVFAFMGGMSGLETLCFYIYDALASFTLLPVPMFILMGEFLFNADISKDALDVIDSWTSRIPGRLSLVAVVGGVLFAFLSGSSIASVAALGTLLVPEMTKRGYSKGMAIGPILGAGQLAVIIPPSLLIVILGNLADVSVGQLLVAGILPGILLAFVFCGYIVVRCWLNPSLAPHFETAHVPLMAKIGRTFRYLVPLGVVIFLVLGVIFVGVATPTEASGLGAAGALGLAICYRKVNWTFMKNSLLGTARTSGMIMLILAGSTAFSQLLSYTGASRGLVELVQGTQLPPLAILFGMILIWLVLGCMIDQISMMMISIPIFMPIARMAGMEPLWFCIIALFMIEMGVVTPPFGLLLFVMKGVTPPDVTMKDIISAAMPFLYMKGATVLILIFFPIVVQILPRWMG